MVDIAERVALFGAGLSRGLRNNNPGNIRRSAANAWKGKIDTPQRAAELGVQWDADYEQFTHPMYGVRAAARLLRNYYHRDGLQTVRQIVTKYAPPSENPTSSYIAYVARALGVGPDEVIPLERRLPELLAAIVHVENGVQPFSLEELSAWANLA